MLPGRASKNLQQQFDQIARLNVRHDVLYWYAATSEARFSPLWVEKHNAGNPEGHWHHFWSTADRKTMRYELFGHTPDTGQWVWEENRAKRAVENHKRYLREAGGRTLAEYWRDTGSSLEFIRENPEDGTPQYWRSPAESRIADTVWAGVPVYSNANGYPTEKNEALLIQIFQLASKQGDLALDAFAGSGTLSAVAEKLGRRWIAVDCGKLAIYIMQKRLLNIATSKDLDDPKKEYRKHARHFTLYNAGLYDYRMLKALPWDQYREFALKLFQCRDEPHEIYKIELDGYLGADSVQVFNYQQHKNVGLDRRYIDELHEYIGNKIGSRFFIIAPAASVRFLEDYIQKGKTKYYILRIPYSMIEEIHKRGFTKIKQPVSELDVNDTVDAVGFDFIQIPKVECQYHIADREGQLELGKDAKECVIKINTFESQVTSRTPVKFENLETLSMVMLDFDFEGDVFDLDKVLFAEELKKRDHEIHFDKDDIQGQMMIIYMDIFGNEKREVKKLADFGRKRTNKHD